MWDRWTGYDGWPVPYPAELKAAIRAIPNAAELEEAEIDRAARRVETAHAVGQFLELSQSRLPPPSAERRAERDFHKLHDLAGKLAKFLPRLHRDAVDALSAQGLDVPALEGKLRHVQSAAYDAFQEFEPVGTDGPKKITATSVTQALAEIFLETSGRHPTFTTDPATGEVSGSWPDVVELAFSALHINASVASQVKAHKSEMARLKGGVTLP
jgi:hypothetical protein